MLKSLFNDFLEDLAKDAVKLINKFLVDLMDIALNWPKLHQYKAFN